MVVCRLSHYRRKAGVLLAGILVAGVFVAGDLDQKSVREGEESEREWESGDESEGE